MSTVPAEAWGLVGLVTVSTVGLLVRWLILEGRKADERLRPQSGLFVRQWSAAMSDAVTGPVWNRSTSTAGLHTTPSTRHDAPSGPSTKQGWREDVINVGVASAGTASLVGGTSAYDWWNPDPEVLAAFGRYRNIDVDNGLDLWRSISGQGGVGALDTDSPDVLVGLRGHLGEQVAARELADAGHDVQFPDGGNNPGWDLSVDGAPWNVKITSDASRSAGEHFEAHPDVNVLVNGDAGRLSADSLHWDGVAPLTFGDLAPETVVAMGGLDADALTAQLSHVLEAANPADALDQAVEEAAEALPGAGAVVTVVLSAGREARLLKEGNTDLGRAGKNVAIDGGARAGGFWAGAQAGASVGVAIEAATGGLLFGAPTAISTVIGGLLGARGGRYVAEKVKSAPLRRAVADLADAAQVYRDEADRQVVAGNDRLALHQQRGRMLVALRALLAARTIAAKEKEAASTIRRAQQVDARAVVSASYENLRKQIENREAWLCGTTPVLTGVRARIARRALDRWHYGAQVYSGEVSGRPARHEMARFWDCVAVASTGRDRMSDYINNLADTCGRELLDCRRLAEQQANAVALTRARTTTSLAICRQQEVVDARARLVTQETRLTTSTQVYERERRAAGLVR